MSNRFGRNQKRKLKDKIVSLEKVTSRLERNKESYEQLASFLPNYFVGGEPQVIAMRGSPDFIRIPEMGLHQFTRADCAVPELLTAMDYELGLFRCEGRRHPIDNAVHLSVYHPEFNTYSYAITKETLKGLPKHRAIDLISRELSRMIINEVARM